MSLISNIVFMPSFNITILGTDTYENRIAPKEDFNKACKFIIAGLLTRKRTTLTPM